MNTITPIKTEYRGIVFDSKSEAILARAFDVINEEKEQDSFMHILWEYHPKNLQIGNYIPDFLITIHTSFENKILILSNVIIEYKPLKPTPTYFKKYEEYYKELKNKDSLNMIKDFTILYGNFFNRFEEQFLKCVEYSRIDDVYKWSCNSLYGKLFSEAAEQAKQFRFDLEHGKD